MGKYIMRYTFDSRKVEEKVHWAILPAARRLAERGGGIAYE